MTMTTALSERDVRGIVARASTLYERLAWPHVPPEEPRDRERIDRRLQRWRKTAAAGDEARFAARLAWDGLDEARVRPYLGSALPELDLPLPPWAETLRAMTAAALTANPMERAACRFLEPADPVAYEDALAPFVTWASGQVAGAAGDAAGVLEDGAHAQLENTLLRLLAFQAARPLQVEFAAFRLSRQSGWDRLIARMQPDGSDIQYRAFVHALLTGGFVRFLRAHSAAARRLAMLTDAWIANTTELLRRLAADRAAIAATFNGGRDPGTVTQIEAELSDRHNGGRSVAILTFSSGLRLVYKPKQIASEVAYDHFLVWMHAHGAPWPPRRLALLPRSNYGWVEFAAHAPVADEVAADRFFQRLGALTCIVFALQGNDCHNENIVAAGEHPVLVDAETLLHPHPSARASGGGRDIAAVGQRRLRESVTGTGMLPRWSSTPDGAGFDNSALGGVGGQEVHIERPRWVRVNTDAMDVEPGFVTVGGLTNLPPLAGRPLDPAAYREALLAGFTTTYRWFMAQRPALLAPDGPLSFFATLPVRVILRPTQLYALLMRQITHPDYAAHGIDASIEWELLTRSFAVDGTRPPADWPLYRAEHAAMSAYDVPFFSTNADSAAVAMDGHARVEDYFEAPGRERARATIAAFSEADLAWQTGLIRNAVHLRFDGDRPEALPNAGSGAGLDLTAPLPPAALVAAALTIGERLARQAIRSRWDEATWIGPRRDPENGRYLLEPAGPGLYDGGAGIALFLAALDRQTGGFRDLARAAIRPLHRDPAMAIPGLGGMTGLGGSIYALLQTGVLLDDEALIARAADAVALVTEGRIAADDRLDVLAGAAGMVLALLAVHAHTGAPAALDRAVACGRHLLARRRPDGAGHLAWPTLDGKLLAGFSHGAAGIGYALLALAGATGEEAFRTAALAGFRHERTLFDASAGNWHSYVESVPTGVMPARTSWCHGAPGIGLARVASLPWHDTPAARDEIDIALATTRGAGVDDVDQLCCGHAGRADILLEAGRRLGRDDLRDAARRSAAWLAARAGRCEGFRLLHGFATGGDCPGLFPGVAGIGYLLLRCADEAATLPSVLLLDA